MFGVDLEKAVLDKIEILKKETWTEIKVQKLKYPSKQLSLMSEKSEKLVIKRSGYPSKGEIVIGTVTRVMDFGAFVSLDEYENKEGLVHISEVAPGWIKDIRDYVKKGQKVVCKVLDVNPKRGHIDLSIKDVNERQRREKIQEWKSEQRAFKWLEIAGEKVGIDRTELRKNREKVAEKSSTAYTQLSRKLHTKVTKS